MFSKILSKKFFCQSLKQQKEANLKNKKIESVLKNNQRKVLENEAEGFLQKIEFKTLFIKFGLVFSVAPCVYYLFSKFKYPVFSKQLTDSYNTALNLMSYSNTFYVQKNKI
jgi:hypothetical protein